MNVLGMTNYVSDKGFNDFIKVCKNDENKEYCSLANNDSVILRKLLFRRGNKLAKEMACEKYSILKIGPYLFVHGGINPVLVNNYKIDVINELVHNWLLGQELSEQDEHKLLLDKNISPFWNRDYSLTDDKDLTQVCYDMKSLLKTYNAKYIFMGHTPQKEGINSICNGIAWRTDTGMSQVFKDIDDNFGKIEMLKINKNGGKFEILN
jgi:hypothetical protein